ncbi:DUF1707 domain-containing protein [Rhodococcus sp. NPDC058532]|uniref:DUF1707 SHOCT-like domain-containing protein n=1 Tax=Rhodococcus sp. NPDC058532 TaxID=3346540 RepID=UPI003646BF76
MSPLRDSTRARDTDRTSTRGLLRTAYDDGQLGAGEFHDRLAMAAAADTLGDLRSLTTDLQLPAAVASRHPIGRGRRLGAVAAVAGAALVAGVATLTVAVRGSGDAPSTPAAAGADTASVRPVTVPPDRATPIDPFTEAGIAAVVARYRARFGDTLATSLALYPDAARVTRRAGSPGRVDVHDVAGDVRPVGTEPSPPRAAVVDLTRIDAAGVARLIAAAPALVGAPAGRVGHVLVADSGRPTVTVYVGTGNQAVGYLVAGLDGGNALAVRSN